MSKFMNRPPPAINSSTSSNSSFVEKIMIGLDHAPAAFDLRGQLIGAGGANLHYIRNETGAIATLRGRGSLFIDPSLGTESPEAMHLYVEHSRFEGLQSAKQLAKNLIETMQQELVHYQQTNPPGPTVQYSAQQAPPLPSNQPLAPQMSIPPPNIQIQQPSRPIQQMNVPPPTLQTNVIEPMANAQSQPLQQQNFIQSNQQAIVSAQQQQQQQQSSNIIQSQTIIPQTVPIQLHQGNMVIQQQVNPSIPPPGIHIPVKQGSLLHLQAPPPTAVQLSQPPPNIQIQPQTAQIVLNQAQPNYQYQYIQQAPIQTTADGQQNQVTIQHIYQPQGIVQQSQPTTQFNQFTTQQRPQTQQYIVQGNTAYMMPPPNIIQQQPPPAPPQNIIFQTTNQAVPQQQVQLQPLQMQSQEPPRLNVASNANAGNDDNITVKTEKTGTDDSSVKDEDKTEGDNNTTSSSSSSSSNNNNLDTISISLPPPLPPTSQAQIQIRAPTFPPTTNLSSIAHVPPPIITMPPPMTCVQHIVGNTLITTSQPTQTQTHQIYNPVSIHQIQAPPQQQIHVSTQNGQHFLVNAPQWQPQQQYQQVTSQNGIQSFHLTTAQPMRNPNNPNEIVMSNQAIIGTTSHATTQPQPQQQIFAATFNPHIPAPVAGMQVQLQPINSATATIMHTTMSDAHPQHQLLETPSAQQSTIGQHQMMLQPPLPSNFSTAPPLRADNQGNSPQPVPPPMADHQHQQQLRAAQKRKYDLEDDITSQMPPRIGMGSNSAAYINIPKEMSQPNCSNGMAVATTTGSLATSSTQDETANKGDNLNDRSLETQQQQQQQHQRPKQMMQSQQIQMPPTQSHVPFVSDNNNRQQYYRMPFDGRQHQPPLPPPPRGPGPRFHPQNNRNDIYPTMRPQHSDNNFGNMRFGPPPPPPPPQATQQMYPRFRGQQW